MTDTNELVGEDLCIIISFDNPISLVGSHLNDYQYILYPLVMLVTRLGIFCDSTALLCVFACAPQLHPVWAQSCAIVVVLVRWSKPTGRQSQAAADLQKTPEENQSSNCRWMLHAVAPWRGASNNISTWECKFTYCTRMEKQNKSPNYVPHPWIAIKASK